MKNRQLCIGSKIIVGVIIFFTPCIVIIIQYKGLQKWFFPRAGKGLDRALFASEIFGASRYVTTINLNDILNTCHNVSVAYTNKPRDEKYSTNNKCLMCLEYEGLLTRLSEKSAARRGRSKRRLTRPIVFCLCLALRARVVRAWTEL